MSIRAQNTFTRRSARIPYRRPSQTSSQGDEPVANEAQDAPALEPVVEQQQQTGYQQDDEEMGTAEVNSEAGAMNDDNNSMYDENGKVHFRKIFRERKRPSVRAKEKRLRQNRQLRRTLLPKTALMALHELKTLAISDFSFTQHIPGGFTAHVTVNGKQFDGNGSSKMIAKNAACEAALRDFVIAKMIERPRMRKRQKMSSISESSKMGDEPQTTNSTIENEDLCNTDSQQSGATNNQDDADELPMLNIASFALYKLFSDWEREGYIVPELHPNTEPASEENNTNGEEPAEPAAPKEPKKPTIRTELPANWETMHPATLLCMMRPGLLYTDFGSSGTKNEIVHSMGVTVDGVEYAESGRSKKLARRNVAVSVCNALFGTNFVKEE